MTNKKNFKLEKNYLHNHYTNKLIVKVTYPDTETEYWVYREFPHFAKFSKDLENLEDRNNYKLQYEITDNNTIDKDILRRL